MIINSFVYTSGGIPSDLLVSFEGADESTTFTDLSPSPGTLTGGGGAKIDTAIYPNGALLLNGTSSGSRVTSSKVAAVGTGAFTLESYIRPTLDQYGRIISAQDSGTPNALLQFRVNPGGSVTGWIRSSAGTGSTVITSSSGLVQMDGSAEYHVAFTRDGSGNMNLWLDGVSVASGTATTNPDASRPYYIGAFDNTQERFAGNIRWVRVTEGVCRYESSFTPPSIPYPIE